MGRGMQNWTKDTHNQSWEPHSSSQEIENPLMSGTYHPVLQLPIRRHELENNQIENKEEQQEYKAITVREYSLNLLRIFYSYNRYATSSTGYCIIVASDEKATACFLYVNVFISFLFVGVFLSPTT